METAASLCMGPMQGVENRPAALFKALSPKGKINAIVRLVIHNAMFVFSPRVRRAVSQSDFIFAATPNTKRNLQKYYQTESIYLPENGITSMLARTPVSKSNSEPLRLIWAGELCERKALIILLDALKTIRRTNWELHVAGAGRLRSKMEETAQNYGIASRIVWHGKYPGRKFRRFSLIRICISSHRWAKLPRRYYGRLWPMEFPPYRWTIAA